MSGFPEFVIITFLLNFIICVHCQVPTDLSGIGATTVPHGDPKLSTPSAIISLDLSANAIEVLNDNEFAAYTKLKDLHLNNNSLHTVSASAFTGTVMEYLNLSGNKLTAIPSLAIIPTIDTLWITYNRITSIPKADLDLLDDVKYLKIGYNPLTVWPDFSGYAENELLASLDVSGIDLLIRIPTVVCRKFEELIWDDVSLALPDIGNCLALGALSKLDSFGLSKRINDSSNFNVFKGLGSNFSKLDISDSAITVFPYLPPAIRTNNFHMLTMNRANAATFIDADRLEGFDFEKVYMDSWSLKTFPCKLFDITKTLKMNNNDVTGYQLSMDAGMWRRCWCHKRTTMRLRQLLWMGKSLLTLTHFPDLTYTLCGFTENGRKLNLRWIPSNCDCSVVFFADLDACGWTVKTFPLLFQCNLPTNWAWADFKTDLNCPDNFALIYPNVDFAGAGILIEVDSTVSTIPAVFSIVIRGNLAWRVSSVDGDLHLRPGSYPNVNLITPPDNIEIMAQSDLVPPAGATPFPTPATGCEARPNGNFIDLLGDGDIDSCFKITELDDRQEFTFLHRQPTAGVGYVDVTSRDLDCRHPFFVEVFVERDLVPKCDSKANPVMCPLETSEELEAGVTKCTFKCDCTTAECRMDNEWKVYITDFNTGYLCEVRIYL